MLTIRQSLRSIPLKTRGIITYSKQSQLYIHPQSNNKHLVSFFKNPKSTPIGEFYSKNPESDEITTKNFIGENKEFLKILHNLIKTQVADDFTYAVESKGYSEEHMPIYDLRKVPNYQRQPDIEDTFGFVRVDSEGEILGETYEENGLYNIVSVDGPIKLSDHLHEKLKELD